MLEKLLTPKEVAQALLVTESTLASWRSRGPHQIPFVKLGSGRVRYRTSDIERFIHQCVPQRGACTS